MIIHDDEDRNKVIKKILDIDLSKKPWEVTAKPYVKKRSLPQNALAAMWYRDRGKSTGHKEEYERCTCKLNYGIPIMMQESYFAELWEPYSKLPYEIQHKAMKIVDVTSLMNTEQMTDYMYMIEEESLSQGIELTKPKHY